MKNDHRHLSVLRQLCWMLAMFAVGLRMFFPVGYMAAPTQDGMPFALVLCSGDGLFTGHTDDNLPKHTGTDDLPGETEHQPCPAGGHGTTSTPPLLLTLTRVEHFTFVETPHHDNFTPPRDSARPALPPRGPPHLSA